MHYSNRKIYWSRYDYKKSKAKFSAVSSLFQVSDIHQKVKFLGLIYLKMTSEKIKVSIGMYLIYVIGNFFWALKM